MKINILNVETIFGLEEIVEIEISEGHFTQMPKSVYDEQQKALKVDAK